MTSENTLKKRVPAAWAAASITLTIAAVAAVSFLQLNSAQARPAEQAAMHSSAPSVTGEVESALRDESLSPDERIDKALRILNNPQGTSTGKTEPAASVNSFGNSAGLPSASFSAGQWDPFSEMARMRQVMDRLFSNSMSRFQSASPVGGWGGMSAWSPQVETDQTDSAYIYKFELHGVDKDQVKVSIDQGRLILQGTRESRSEKSDKDSGAVSREVQRSEFRREMSLPADADSNATIESSLKNGVLTVTVPKTQTAKSSGPRTIDIK
ncbi:MAG: Hsp20/alpha crystallin family protein [Candidatus Sumerlaeaceae bacterium]|nr:Hsp20/alpha crystallin family protein [Candidatus Sumerlaeaceae bacterium]